jgi:hypothetical protein
VQFLSPPQICMAIYPIFKAVITSTAAVSIAIFTAGCSPTPSTSQTSAAAEAAGTAPIGGGSSNSSSNSPDTSKASASKSANTQSATTQSANKGVSTNHDIYHSKALEVPAGTLVPAISVRVDSDTERGWNLYVGTANFTFAPEDVGGESSPSEGHAQLYINEKPMQRIYSTWTHLPELPPGKNTLRVTLNANGYETLTTQNVPIQESTTVEVYDPKAASASSPN